MLLDTDAPNCLNEDVLLEKSYGNLGIINRITHTLAGVKSIEDARLSVLLVVRGVTCDSDYFNKIVDHS